MSYKLLGAFYITGMFVFFLAWGYCGLNGVLGHDFAWQGYTGLEKIKRTNDNTMYSWKHNVLMKHNAPTTKKKPKWRKCILLLKLAQYSVQCSLKCWQVLTKSHLCWEYFCLTLYSLDIQGVIKVSFVAIYFYRDSQKKIQPLYYHCLLRGM